MTVYVGNLEEVSTTQSASTTTTYYYAAGKRIALAVNGAFSYLGTDGLGSTTVALDANGNVQASALYGPYGTARSSSGAMPGSYGFTGQRADSATGLDYYNARYYDPVAGQFMSADTANDGLNRYGYVHGNPETATDPSGHMRCFDDACAGESGGEAGPQSPRPVQSVRTAQSRSTAQRMQPLVRPTGSGKNQPEQQPSDPFGPRGSELWTDEIGGGQVFLRGPEKDDIGWHFNLTYEPFGGSPTEVPPYFNWHLRFAKVEGLWECGSYEYIWSATDFASQNALETPVPPIIVSIPGYSSLDELTSIVSLDMVAQIGEAMFGNDTPRFSSFMATLCPEEAFSCPRIAAALQELAFLPPTPVKGPR